MRKFTQEQMQKKIVFSNIPNPQVPIKRGGGMENESKKKREQSKIKKT